METSQLLAHRGASEVGLLRAVKLNRARAGNPATSFGPVYEAHYRDVYRYLLVLIRHPEDAEDLASETFERAFRAWTRDGPRDTPLAWLLRIARHLSTDRWRRARRVIWQRLGTGEEQMASSTGDAETWLWLQAFASCLSERQREVVVLRYLRDLSDEQIGAIMGLTPSGVRSLLGRAMASLRSNPEVWK